MLGSELLTRYNLYPAVSIIGGPAPGYSSGQALTTMERVAEQNLPLGMDYDWTGLSYQEKLIGNQAYFIFALSITLVFLVLAGQYESWTDPAAVILTVPMALVGRAGRPDCPRISHRPVHPDRPGADDRAGRQERDPDRRVRARDQGRGRSAVEAAVEATRRRFRPIVMTSIAFILGVVPLLTATGAGAASQQSLGTVVFGGMLASTLVAIPFVSVFYIVMESFAEWRTKEQAKRRRTEVRPPRARMSAENRFDRGTSAANL